MATPDTGIDANLNGAIPFDMFSQWNIPVANAPVLWDSAAIMASLGTNVGVHADFGSGTYNGITIGIPYVIVPAGQPLVPFIDNLYTSESDPGPFPIPPNPPIQGLGATAYNDNHLIVLQLDANGNLATEYDFFQISQTASGTWQGYAATFNLTQGDDQRPVGWTSANAAGLPEFPGLVTYDEVQAAIAAGGVNGYIPHALAITLDAWDIGSALAGAAEHATGGTGAASFGMRFVLNPAFQIDQSLPIEDIVILNTLKLYGAILTDNGANFFLAGAPDPRWNNSDLAYLQTAVSASDFEIVDTTGLVPPPAITVGTGPDALVLQVSEAAYDGNAQFTVSVAGTQIGGVQTIQALASLNETQTFTFLGNWGAVQQTATITFVNPLTDANGSRNVVLQGVSYDGAATAANAATLSATNATVFKIGTIPTVGAGADTLVLHICELAYKGDAAFTVSVNGIQIGGLLTATTAVQSGQTEDFDVFGNWGTGRQAVTVSFANGLSDPGGARDLFVWGMTYDGAGYGGNVQNLYGGGTAAFLVGTAAPIGAGADTLVLNLVETAYQGDAQFTISVNGVQIGGVQTATLPAGSKAEPFTVLGNWGQGRQTVTVTFINGLSDAGGSRNLYVEGMTYDGTSYGDNVHNLYGGGAACFLIGTAAPIGSGPDTLTVNLWETAYQGDAQFTVSVNGVQVGGVQTATMPTNGKTEPFTFEGNWGPGKQTVTINFVNGMHDSGGSRNLFVEGMTYDGTNYGNNVQNMWGGGTGSFSVGSNTIAVSSATLAGSPSMSFITPTAPGQTLAGDPAFNDDFQAATAALNGATIASFGGNDVIDLTDMGFAGVTGTYAGTPASGLLTITNGSHAAAITLTGGSAYAPNVFKLVSDGQAGTALVLG